MVTGCPVSLTQTVKGSDPTCSLVAPFGIAPTPFGTVMGKGVLHLFPLMFVLTVTLTTEPPSSEWFKTKYGLH